MADPHDTAPAERPADLFISYAWQDLARASALHDRLCKAGFTVWFDKARLSPGCDWHEEIEAGCKAAKVILPLITPKWAKSEWTRYETYPSNAIIPVLAEGIAEAVMPPPLRRWNAHGLDPLSAGEEAWQALFAAIRRALAEPAPVQADRIVDLPYPANPFFTGRDDDLVRIHEALHEAPVATLTKGKVSVLAAMGGIGKTTLANEYARRFWRLYPQILWIDARPGLEAGFARLFEKLFPARAGDDLKQPKKASLALAELGGRLERLLIIDNVEDAESVRPWLPDQPQSGCRILITSRFSDWPREAGIRSVPLYVIEPEPAREFLIRRTGRSAEGAELDACDALAKELGYLPLALEQAGAYIAAPGAGVTFAGYMKLYESASAELLARGARGSTEYPDAVLITWQATVEKLTPESRAILRLCAWYADTPIPRVLIMDGADDVLAVAAQFGPVAPLAGPAAAELRMRDALTGLALYSMILDADGDATFRVHGLVQAVERVRAAQEYRDQESRNHGLARLRETFPHAYNDPTVWPLCRQLLPHQKALTGRLSADEESVELPVLLGLTGSFMLALGDAAGALPLFRRALETRERVLGPDHPDTLTSVNNLAECMQTLGDAAGALPLYRRALEGCERVLGPDHPDTLTSVNNLAECMRALGDAAGALPLYRRALEGCERVLGPDHPDTLTSVNNLAVCMQTLGDAAGALPLFRRALETRERVLGPDHPDTLTSVNNLAECMRALGDAAGALPLYRRALEGCERVLGPDHPDTLTSVNNLAECMRALGDAAGALPLYRRALEGCERVLGPDHPDTLTSVNNLAVCMQTLGDAAGALSLYRRALETRERVLGPDHPDTLTSVNNLAGCMQTLGDAAGALPLFRRALETRERVLGPDHPDTLTSVNNLAGCMQTLGDAAGALPLYRRALEGCERVLGPDHPHTLTSVSNLTVCMRELGDAAGALPLYRRALEGCERVLGPDHPDTLTSVNNLAVCMQTLGDAAGALPLFRRALETRERVLGPDHPDTLTSVNNLAECMRALGDAAGALPLYRRALEGCERVLGPDHPDTLTSVNNLAECMRALGDAAGALPLYRRALEGCERVLGPDHPDTLTSVNNLAVCMQTLGDAAGALSLYRRALETRERVLGPDHPDTLTSVNNLAGCMQTLGDAAGALPLFRRALERCERVLGSDHPDTLGATGVLAVCLDNLGLLDEAATLHLREVEGLERRLGEEHSDVLTARNNLAFSMRKAGRADLAMPHARRVSEISERVLAHDPPRRLFRRGNLALTLLMAGEIAEARRLLAEVWTTPATDCANTTPVFAFLGLIAARLGDGDGAPALGRLKTLLIGSKLPIAAGVAQPWDAQYLIDNLAPRLPARDPEFLTALLAAINDPAVAAALGRFPAWRDAAPIARDAPWPELAGDEPTPTIPP